MVRTQVQLTQKQLQTLRQLSAARGRSIAELIRQGVELYLGSQQRPGRDQQIERALRVAGRFSSGSADGSLEHDRHLAEALHR
jgi:Arc/MetJ-type ribon-helix-helix transcriptional regulator